MIINNIPAIFKKASQPGPVLPSLADIKTEFISISKTTIITKAAGKAKTLKTT